MTDTQSHTIRFPKELKEQIKQLAEQDRRNFNSEVIWLLEQAVNTQTLGMLTMSLQDRKESAPK